MGLNIKNDEAHELAAELAKLTGQSMTAVVIESLRLHMEKLERYQDKETRLEGLFAALIIFSTLSVSRLNPDPC